jgi:hypothetical protein
LQSLNLLNLLNHTFFIQVKYFFHAARVFCVTLGSNAGQQCDQIFPAVVIAVFTKVCGQNLLNEENIKSMTMTSAK